MRVEVVEGIPEPGAREAADDSSIKLGLQSFQSAMQGEASFLDCRRSGNLHMALGEDGRATCSGGFLLSFRGKEFSGDRGLYFQLIQKLSELLEHAGSPEILTTWL